LIIGEVQEGTEILTTIIAKSEAMKKNGNEVELRNLKVDRFR
jgi:hypothetical protein